MWMLLRRGLCRGGMNEVPKKKVDHALPMALLQANIVEPHYYKVLLEIKVGRRFWQFNPSAENAHAFYVRVVEPLRRFQRRGVVERLQEITATDDRTPIAVEIIGQVDRTKLSKQ
jgi:hypothetical protein